MINIKVYRVEDSMKFMGVTRRTIYNHIKGGKIKGQKVVSKWIFTEEQVSEYMKGDKKGESNE